MSRSFGGTSLTRLVPMRISPELISSRPAIIRRSVDLPQPDGPTRTVNEPSAMSMSTPWSTAVSPKLFFTDWIVTLAMEKSLQARKARAGASIGNRTDTAMRANR